MRRCLSIFFNSPNETLLFELGSLEAYSLNGKLGESSNESRYLTMLLSPNSSWKDISEDNSYLTTTSNRFDGM